MVLVNGQNVYLDMNANNNNKNSIIGSVVCKAHENGNIGSFCLLPHVFPFAHMRWHIMTEM